MMMKQFCPLLYYPLPENLPSLYPGILRPQNIDDQLRMDTRETLEVTRKFLTSHYRSEYGFFKMDLLDPNSSLDLLTISKFFIIAKVFGFIDTLEKQIPGFSNHDATIWILKHVFSRARNPLRKRSLYRYRMVTDPAMDEYFELRYIDAGIPKTITCQDVTASLTILYLLDTLNQLEEFCDPKLVGQGLARLQTKEGHFRSSIYTNFPDRLRAPETTFSALVGMTLLDNYFDTNSLISIRIEDLKKALIKRLNEYLTSQMDPTKLFDLYYIIASLKLLAHRLDERLDLASYELEKFIMRTIGLLPIWIEYQKSHHASPNSFFKGFDFSFLLSHTSSTNFSYLTKESPSKLIEKGGWFSIYPAIGCLTLLDASAAIGLVLPVLEVWKIFNKFSQENSFLWSSLYYPFILRHCPLITLELSPQLLFKGDQELITPLKNNSAYEVTSLRLKKPTKRTTEYITNINKRFRVSIREAKLDTANLDPAMKAFLSLKIKLSENYPRYPYLEFPDLFFSCKYAGKKYEFSIDQSTIQVLPRRSTVLDIIHTESPKVNYNPEDTIRALQRAFLERFQFYISEPTTRSLYYQLVPHRFNIWINQFDPKDRPLIQKLYLALRFYSSHEVQEKFRIVLRSKHLHAISRYALFVGLGKHQAKSGIHMLYFVKHIYREMFPSVKSNEVQLRFQHPSEVLTNPQFPKLKINAVILIDDFIGTGRQAVSEIENFSHNYPDLSSYTKYFITVTGFTKGKDKIIRCFPELSNKIFAADRFLNDNDRAFSFPSHIFKTNKELTRAKHLCRTIGNSLLKSKFTDPVERKKHVLGWDNDQALIAFEHNTPNNTLPIFWAKGTYNGKRWQPLFQRKE